VRFRSESLWRERSDSGFTQRELASTPRPEDAAPAGALRRRARSAAAGGGSRVSMLWRVEVVDAFHRPPTPHPRRYARLGILARLSATMVMLPSAA